MEHKEIPYIHYIRVIACIGVLCIHCNHKIQMYHEYDEIFRQILHTIAQQSVPLFFMITGALILTSNKQISAIEFYKKRIPRILFPLVIWGIVYAILPYFTSGLYYKSVIYDIISLPFTHPKEFGGILWYLYVLIGLYLIIPFISTQIYTNKKLTNIYLTLWICSSLGFIIRLFYPYIWGESYWINSYDALLYFSGYYGFLLLGFKLHNFNDGKSQIKKNIVFLMLSLLLTYAVREQSYGIEWGHQRGWFIYPTSIVTAYFTYKIIRDIKINKTSILYKIIKHISKYTFGIYLCHMALYVLLTKALLYPYSTAWYTQIVTILTTLTLSYLLCRLIEKLPFSKYIIGV